MFKKFLSRFKNPEVAKKEPEAISNEIAVSETVLFETYCNHEWQLQCKSKHGERLNEISIQVSAEYRNCCKKCGATNKVEYRPEFDMPPPFILESPGIWHDYNPKPIRTVHFSEILRIEHDENGKEIKILDFNKLYE